MTDEHQPIAVIATALLDTFKDDNPDHLLGAEEAKIIAKRIVAAFEEAGLRITLVDVG